MDREQKKREEKQQKILAELLARPENQKCADCSMRGPKWASVSIGCFLCIRCAGLHRKMGSHISKVKSTNLDTWTQEWIDVLVNSSSLFLPWEMTKSMKPICPEEMPQESTLKMIGIRNLSSDMESFIRNKYEKKLYSLQSTASVSQAHSKEYSSQMHQLQIMGFNNKQLNLEALSRNGGNIERSIEYIVSTNQAQQTQPKKEPSAQSQYNSQLQQLQSMGFTNQKLNLEALERNNGSLEKSIEFIVSQTPASPVHQSLPALPASPVRQFPQQQKQQQQQQPQQQAVKAQAPSVQNDLLDIFSSPPAQQSYPQSNFPQQQSFTPNLQQSQMNQQNFGLQLNPFAAQQNSFVPQAQSNQLGLSSQMQPNPFNQQSQLQQNLFAQQNQPSLNAFGTSQAFSSNQFSGQQSSQNIQNNIFQDLNTAPKQQSVNPFAAFDQPKQNSATPFGNQQQAQFFPQSQPLIQNQQQNNANFAPQAMKLQQQQNTVFGGQQQSLNPQEQLFHEQKAEYEGKKQLEQQKESILSMFKAAPTQQAPLGFNSFQVGYQSQQSGYQPPQPFGYQDVTPSNVDVSTQNYQSDAHDAIRSNESLYSTTTRYGRRYLQEQGQQSIPATTTKLHQPKTRSLCGFEHVFSLKILNKLSFYLIKEILDLNRGGSIFGRVYLEVSSKSNSFDA
jgi:hypothetical protein